MFIRIKCPDCGYKEFKINEEEYPRDEPRTAITVNCPDCGRIIWTGTNINALKKTYSYGIKK